MAATSVLKLELDVSDYSSSIKDAKRGMLDLEKALHDAGKSFTNVDKSIVDFAKEIGNMNTSANQSKGQLREMTQTLTEMTRVYRQLSETEKKSPFGKALLQSIDQLTERAGVVQDAMDDVQASIKNAASDTRLFDQVAGSVNVAVSTIQTLQGSLKMLGVDLGDDVKVLAQLQAAMAVTNGLTQIQNQLQEQSAVMQGVLAVKAKALAIATELQAKSTKTATIAQKAFNAVANANPYVLLATGIGAVIGALALFTSGSDDATDAQKRFNAEAEKTKTALDDLKKRSDFGQEIARAAGAGEVALAKMRLEAAKAQYALAMNGVMSAQMQLSALQGNGSISEVLAAAGHVGEMQQIKDEAAKALREAQQDVYKAHYLEAAKKVAKSAKESGKSSGSGTSSKNAVPSPQDSIVGLTEDLQYLQKEQQKATNPEEWRTYADAIRFVEDEIKKVKGELSSLGTVNTTGSWANTKYGVSISGIISDKIKSGQDSLQTQKLKFSAVPLKKNEVDTTQKMAELLGGVSSIVSSLNQLGVDIPKGFSNVLSGMQAVITILEAIQTIQTVGSILGIFHNGGIVPHAASGYMVPGSRYSNDVTPVLANAGELILSKSQQGNLASQLSGQNGGYAAQPYVNGEMIILGVNTHLNRSGQGEIVTTKMLKSMGLIN